MITYLKLNIGLKTNIVIALEAQKWMNENWLQIVHNALALCGETQPKYRQLQFIYQMTSRYFLVILRTEQTKQTSGFSTFCDMRSESSTLTFWLLD